MAIIRIKRTTGNLLPQGLTFGELAFVQGSGKTANRLYIADNAGVCVWVGAQIINQPTFWKGDAAETSIPTLSAVESRIAAGGGLTFNTNLTVNIAETKTFGKYKKNDVIPSFGQTVKWLIEDALSESIPPLVTLSRSPTNLLYGQTGGTIVLTPTYTIKTAGASAAGSTLEWRYAGQANWTVLSTALKSDAFGQDQQYSTTFNHTTWNRASDVGSGGTYGNTSLEYRWTVHDTAGASATSGAIAVTTTSIPANATVSISGNTAATLRTGVLGSVSGTESNIYREKGNTFTTLTFTITQGNIYVPLRNYVLQARERTGNSTSWGAWTTVKNEAVSTTPTSTSITRGLTYSPSSTSANLDAMQFRFRINDLANNQIGGGTTLDVEGAANSEVFFDYLMFYGGTANTNINSTMIRGLSSGIVAGNHNGSGGGANGGAGALPTSITPVMSSANAVAATGPNSNTRFIVAVPDDVTLTTVNDIFLANQNITSAFNLSSTVTTVPDRNNDNKNYNVYIMSVTGYEDGVHTHTVQRSGTVTKP